MNHYLYTRICKYLGGYLSVFTIMFSHQNNWQVCFSESAHCHLNVLRLMQFNVPVCQLGASMNYVCKKITIDLFLS